MSKAEKMFKTLKMKKTESINTVNGIVELHTLKFERITQHEYMDSQFDSVIVNVLNKDVQIENEHKRYSSKVISATYELLKELGWLDAED